jgi:hypothetical protein
MPDTTITADTTYTILINEMQRALFLKSVNYMIASLNKARWLTDAEEDESRMLRDMLGNFDENPLSTDGINSFVD